MIATPATTDVAPAATGRNRRVLPAPGWSAPRRLWLLAITATVALGVLFQMVQGRPGFHTPMWAVWVHLVTVVPAAPLGAWLIWRKRKGDRAHRIGGRIWGVLMLVTALDSFWIRTITGTVGPLHIFSVMTLISLPVAIWHVRNGRIAEHERAVRGVFYGLMGAGFFAMAPGRYLWSLMFG